MHTCDLCKREIRAHEALVANNKFYPPSTVLWQIVHRRCYNHILVKYGVQTLDVQVIAKAVEQELFLISRRRYGW